MKLSNYKYDVLMQRFDNKRMHARYELDKRIAEVYEKLPEIKEIDSCIASVSVNAGKSALMGDDSALLKLNENIKQLSDEKKRLLTENGYTPDYLEEHFECPKCKDTGFIGNEPCECFKVAETELILESSNIKDVLSKENFATFNAELYSNELEDYDKELQCTPYKNILSVYEKVKAFTQDFDKEHKNLLIYGSTGLGKTFLTNCIANEVLRSKHTVMYYTTFSLFDMLSKYIRSDNEYKEQSSYRDSVITCELLIQIPCKIEAVELHQLTVDQISDLHPEAYLDEIMCQELGNIGSIHYGGKIYQACRRWADIDLLVKHCGH